MSQRIKHTHTPSSEPVDADQFVSMVQALSSSRGERMTNVRRDVITMLAELGKPHTAYQILAEINKKRSPKLSAMSLYRTLDFLIELGVVVKLDSQNTYKLCSDHPHDHSHLMIICDVCHETQEIDDHATTDKLEHLARKHGHKLKHHVIELHGVCSHCTG